DTPSKRVYVGFNPALEKDPRRAEQLGALRPAERVGFHPSGDTPSKRAYVGFNPALEKDPRRAEQLGALRPHKRLSRATPEASAAGEKCFEQSLLSSGFRKAGYNQALTSTLIDKSRCYPYVILNDVQDAYMHLWLLPSNRRCFTVNTTPLSDEPTLYEFCCLPYGPSHCPRVLEVTLQWLVHHNFKGDESFELASFMDDLAIFSHVENPPVERELAAICKDHDLMFKPTKRQALTETDSNMLGVAYIESGRYITMPPQKLGVLKS
ncbi:hypothetical protein FOZ63_011745, partial [Perkinsus olseni]